MEKSLPMYDFQDWLADCSYFFGEQSRLLDSGVSGFPSDMIPHYFQKKYGSRAVFHQARLTRALSYLEEHLEEFDEGKIAIVGEKEAAVGMPLLVALYRVYGRMPDEYLDNEVSLEMVQRFAREGLSK